MPSLAKGVRISLQPAVRAYPAREPVPLIENNRVTRIFEAFYRGLESMTSFFSLGTDDGRKPMFQTLHFVRSSGCTWYVPKGLHHGELAQWESNNPLLPRVHEEL